MNIQTYENCIKTLESEIKSRQQQRKSMEQTIKQLDRDIEIQIQKNKSLREEITHIAQANQKIINQLRKFQLIVHQKDLIIQNNLTTHKQKSLHIETLQKQKQALHEQLKQKDQSLVQKDTELKDLEKIWKKVLQQIAECKKDLDQKRIDLTQITEQYKTRCEENAKMQEKLTIIKTQHEIQKQQLTIKILQSQSSASLISADLQKSIHSYQAQLKTCKQFNKNQLQTLQFNHQTQVKQFRKQIKSLQSKVQSQSTEILHHKEEQTKIKQHYETQLQSVDKVVNQLINQINFLKQEKVQHDKQKSLKLQETVQHVITMGLQLAERQAKTKAFQNEINSLKDQLAKKEKQIFKLNKQIQKLNLQLEISTKQHKGEKDIVSKKNDEIAQLRKYIENLKKFLDVAEKEKTTLAKRTSKQIQTLKNENLELSLKLQNCMIELKELRIKSAELESNYKFLNLQKITTSSSKAELQALVKAHEFTIEKLQNMHEQTKKVVVDLNKLMKIKLAQIDSLEQSNQMFRKQKVQWIKKEQDYRKRIGQYKATSSAARRVSLNESSFISRTRISHNQKDKSDKSRTHSMIIPNHLEKQFAQQRKSINLGSGFSKNKTMMLQNSSQKINDNHSDNSIGSSSQGSEVNQDLTSIGSLPPAHNQNAFKKSEVMKAKKQSIDLSLNPSIPVLTATKKEEQIQLSSSKNPNVQLDEIRQNHFEPQTTVQIRITKPSEIALEENQNHTPTQTHPKTPAIKDRLEPIIETISQNLTPQFHAQAEHSDSPDQNQHSQQKQAEQNQDFKLEFNLKSDDEENEETNEISFPKKISPINSQIITNQNNLEDNQQSGDDNSEESAQQQNEIIQLQNLKEKEQTLSHQEEEVSQDSVEAQNTVNGINILLDRLNVEQFHT